MKHRGYLMFSVILVAIAALTALPLLTGGAAADPEDDLVYEVKAENPRLNRLVVGEVVADLQGVPAEPVHSFVWDGNGSEFIEGWAKLEIDPVSNTGEIVAEWTDRNGEWRFKQEMFVSPAHADGLRFGSVDDGHFLDIDDPVPLNVYLHGDTTAGGPVLPTLFNLIATWGPAEVILNGEPFENPYDGPAPLWVAHSMTTPGVRGDDGTVRTADGEIFDPAKRSVTGAIDYDDMEFHLVFHDAPGPVTSNFPPPLSFFYHLTFEDVKLEVKHAD